MLKFGTDANENHDPDKLQNAPAPEKPPGLPPTPPPLETKEVSPTAMSIPGHMFAGFALQLVGLVAALILLVSGVVFYVGFKNSKNEVNPY